MLMTGVIPDTFPEAPSFLNEEIEYLEFESLIDELSERLDASWSYDPDQEVYQIEFMECKFWGLLNSKFEAPKRL